MIESASTIYYYNAYYILSHLNCVKTNFERVKKNSLHFFSPK